MVASFFSEIADGDLCGRQGFSSVAPLPGLTANLPPLHDVALNGDGTVAVGRGPLDGDGRLGLVLDHSVHRGIGRMLPRRWRTNIDGDAVYVRDSKWISTLGAFFE